jgi:hypothetical protein
MPVASKSSLLAFVPKFVPLKNPFKARGSKRADRINGYLY